MNPTPTLFNLSSCFCRLLMHDLAIWRVLSIWSNQLAMGTYSAEQWHSFVCRLLYCLLVACRLKYVLMNVSDTVSRC